MASFLHFFVLGEHFFCRLIGVSSLVFADPQMECAGYRHRSVLCGVNAMFSIQTILHPTDFSQPSRGAFRFACSLASDYNASLVIVHVANAPVILRAEVIFPGTEDCQEKLEEELLRMQYRMAGSVLSAVWKKGIRPRKSCTLRNFVVQT